MIAYVASFIAGLAVGAVSTAILASGFIADLREQVYREGVAHGRMQARIATPSGLLAERLAKRGQANAAR